MIDFGPYSSFLGPAWWRITLSSIGDGVIAADANGNIVFINSAAEALTGWAAAEALGRPLREIFHIVNETTRAAVEDPVSKVIATGRTVGLANHTVLIHRRGGEMPIDDSAAPICDETGRIAGVVLVFRDVTERRRTEAVQAYLSAIVEHSDDAIIGKDLHGVITSWNRGAERIFGYTHEEALGRSITLIIPANRLSEETEIMERLQQGERIEHFETVRRRKDGSDVFVSITISPIKNSVGAVIGASKIARDITERKMIEQEREVILQRERAARAAAEEASRLKDDFLATVSHELRTPLHSILGWAALLRAGKIPAESATQALSSIERSARTQAELIDDILDVSRIITGKLRLQLELIMPASIVESAITAVRPMAEAKGVRLETSIDHDAGPVFGDAARLQQVVWNLLTNGIKFTPAGGLVAVRVQRVSSKVRISVRDSGQGIDPEFLPHVFDRFRQEEGGTARQHGGLGLGLAIVRHIVELHGGNVTAESEGPGKGATFSVHLPVYALHREEARSRSDPAQTLPEAVDPPPDLTGVTVLIVDDEPDARELLRSTLEQAGAIVREAESAAAGLQEVHDWKPSIILCDLGMPHEDGYDFIAKHRQFEKQSGLWTPAVALTAYARQEDQVRCLAAGFQAHISKPIEPSEILFIIANHLGRERGAD